MIVVPDILVRAVFFIIGSTKSGYSKKALFAPKEIAYYWAMFDGKSGVVVTGGLAAEKKWFDLIKERFTLIVAADSGYRTAMEIGAKVDFAVGDMDSIGDRQVLKDLPKESVITFSPEKDFTDTEIGLNLLSEKGCVFKAIYGGGGGRLDHLIGIFALFDRDNGPDIWVTDTAVVVRIRERFVLKGMAGSTISFFPIGTNRCTMISTGLKWPLNGLKWTKGDAGVSNQAVSDTVEVQMRTGSAVFVGELETLKGMGWGNDG